MQLHATCIAWNGRGALLLGASGAGKSDIALRIITLGATLVADDQVVLTREGEELMAEPLPQGAGLLEVRGVGVVSLPFHAPCPVALACELVAQGAVMRMPEARAMSWLGVDVPVLTLFPWEASAAAKLIIAMENMP